MITPSQGYDISSIIDNGVDVTSLVAGGVYTISNINANHTLTATFALPPAVNVSVFPATQSVANGATFTIDLAINTNTASRGWQANLDFDPSKLTAASITEGGFLKDWALAHGDETVQGPTPAIDNTGGHITNIAYAIVGTADLGGPSGGGTLCTVSFTAKNSVNSSTNITPSSVWISDVNGAGVAGVTITGGEVNIGGTLDITTTSLPDGDLKVPYSQLVNATGGQAPYIWSIKSGKLPYKLLLNVSTGLISGLPSAGGAFHFNLQVADGAGAAATKDLTIKINKQPIISATAFSKGEVGSLYSQTLKATGGSGTYSWSVVSDSGSLPPGLEIVGQTIAGTPTLAGTYTFTLQVNDGIGTAIKSRTIIIYPGLDITTSSLSSGAVGTTYSQKLSATGGKQPYKWSIAAGSLPSGLTLASGKIRGIPKIEGNFSFTLHVSDGMGVKNMELSIIIYPAFTITNTRLPRGYIGSAYTATIEATGGTGTYNWTITGSLPDGLTASSAGGVLVISGIPVPPKPRSFSFKVTVSDGVLTKTQTYTITISKAL